MKKELIKEAIQIHRKFIFDHRDIIESHEKCIEEIQSDCKHDEGWQEDVTVCWAPGHSMEVSICKICGYQKSRLTEVPKISTCGDASLNIDMSEEAEWSKKEYFRRESIN